MRAPSPDELAVLSAVANGPEGMTFQDPGVSRIAERCYDERWLDVFNPNRNAVAYTLTEKGRAALRRATETVSPMEEQIERLFVDAVGRIEAHGSRTFRLSAWPAIEARPYRTNPIQLLVGLNRDVDPAVMASHMASEMRQRLAASGLTQGEIERVIYTLEPGEA